MFVTDRAFSRNPLVGGLTLAFSLFMAALAVSNALSGSLAFLGQLVFAGGLCFFSLWAFCTPYVEVDAKRLLLNRSLFDRSAIRLKNVKTVRLSPERPDLYLIDLRNGYSARLDLRYVASSQRAELLDTLQEAVA